MKYSLEGPLLNFCELSLLIKKKEREQHVFLGARQLRPHVLQNLNQTGLEVTDSTVVGQTLLQSLNSI